MKRFLTLILLLAVVLYALRGFGGGKRDENRRLSKIGNAPDLNLSEETAVLCGLDT